MQSQPSSLLFDKKDYQLLEIVVDVVEQRPRSKALQSLLEEHMHPHGIKEMAAPQGLRVAYAMAKLLDSFDKGGAAERIKALQGFQDEVQLSFNFYRKNAARAQLQIMKELMRSKGDELLQLKLAHDFRMVATGNPRTVRAQLEKFHLLEMPEEWNQFAFDHHVHDANTKGRKSPTHLVTDAWLKGIRHLTVVYYNFVRPDVVRELIEAGEILDVKVQVGIEMSCRFHDKYVRFTWEPHDFASNSQFLNFLEHDETQRLMAEARQVSLYQQRYVFEVFDRFNEHYRPQLSNELQLNLAPLDLSKFLAFIGVGQPSLLHLSRYIRDVLAREINSALETDDGESHEGGEKLSEIRERRLAALGVEAIMDEFLVPSRNPQLQNPNRPPLAEDEDTTATVPGFLQQSPQVLIRRLLALHSSSRFVLNLGNLSLQDTLELLYDCEGMITHIEAFNLADAAHGMTSGISSSRDVFAGEAVDLKSPERNYKLIGDLQRALNEDNVISLKRAIRAIIWEHEERYQWLVRQLRGKKDKDPKLVQELRLLESRKRRLLDILYNLEKFHNYYKRKSLLSRIGSGSTGQAEHRHGMGFVVVDTLPLRSQRKVYEAAAKKDRTIIPVSALLTRNSYRASRYLPEKASNSRGVLGLAWLLKRRLGNQWLDWSVDELVVHAGIPGNIATLGGISKGMGNGVPPSLNGKQEARGIIDRTVNWWKYLNTSIRNSLKVLLGFIPAFLTFYLTKDWWLLAWFGAVIWFGITGSRNIIQAVLGGGGLKRSPLLPWSSLVNWSRIADSLLYTGFSVPLLDFLVKTLLLDKGLGVTTATNPIMLYAVMGLANGMYISGHNILRGLPRAAIIGNFFRSILAIPLAVLLNSLVGGILLMAGVPDVSGMLQKWAAIISKFASDCVAGIIEGLADRQANIRARLTAYRTKISQLFGVFSQLDLLFPEEDVLDILQSPKMTIQTLNYEAREQERYIIVNALDLMYFWMYQPRARKALRLTMEKMSEEEWLIFYRSQLVLKRHKEISQVFVDGLVGKNFSKALAFYLDRSDEYLEDLRILGEKRRWRNSAVT